MIRIMSSDCFMRLLTLAGERHAPRRGERVFSRGEPVRRLHLVVDGEVRLYRDTVEGSRLVLQRARTGEVLAEASLRAARYHCDATATVDTHLHALSVATVTAALASDPSMADAWSAMLALELQATRARAEILRLRGVAARLDAWLALGGGELPARGARHLLADELGITPEALYRELARRGEGR